MGDLLGSFRVMVMVMLFYSVAISVLVYALPGDARYYVTGFTNDDTTNFQGISSEIETSLTRETNIPVIEVGALVFYSGNILIDLLLNFTYALPEMIGFLVHGIELLVNPDPILFAYVETFAAVAMTVLWMIGLIQLVTGIRSGRII